MIKIPDDPGRFDQDECFYSDDELSDSSASDPATYSGPALAGHCEDFFSEASPLANAADYGGREYEYRPQQQRMAAEIALALEANRNLCIEAPTGIGKSFAYLVPLVMYAVNLQRPAVISTGTINLQEQLIRKDIPLLQQLLNIDFTAALAKGRGNYLCRRRLKLLSAEHGGGFLVAEAHKAQLARIGKWAEKNPDGSRSEIDFRLNPETWQLVCSESGNCSGPRCEFFRKCFYWRARREWEKADIVVANHALFLTDLKIRHCEDAENELLPDYCAVVIDEAHTLENEAANHLGVRLSNAGVNGMLNRLFNPETGRGLLLRPGEETLELRAMVADIRDFSQMFFAQMDEFLEQDADQIRRIRASGAFKDLLSEPLSEMKRALKNYAQSLDDDDFRTELEAQLARCEYYEETVFGIVNMCYEDHVYWVEREQRGSLTAQAAPLKVNMLLHDALFNRNHPVILCSATLSVRHSLDYYRSRVGYCGGGELILDSPFSPDQVELYLPRSMPEPNSEDYPAALTDKIKHFVDMTKGRAFVLFTSYQMLRYCEEQLSGHFADQGITLFCQGGDLSRFQMINEFRRDIDSVLFGADSFWTGVDVPGEALSNVIVTRLPFAVPSHPLIQARCEEIDKQNKSSFMEYSLPEAVLKFRQGVGRLVRSTKDKGIIVVLDRRVVSRRYGRIFIDSLPPYHNNYC